MSVEIIGKQIASLRKEKGVKQEELAKYVGVSTQAVSKWENGGVPDVELIPKIADFFSVSIDNLFNRNISNDNLQSVLMKKIAEAPYDRKFKIAFNFCWDIGIMVAPALCGLLGQVFGMVIFPYYLILFYAIMIPVTVHIKTVLKRKAK